MADSLCSSPNRSGIRALPSGHSWHLFVSLGPRETQMFLTEKRDVSLCSQDSNLCGVGLERKVLSFHGQQLETFSSGEILFDRSYIPIHFLEEGMHAAFETKSSRLP